MSRTYAEILVGLFEKSLDGLKRCMAIINDDTTSDVSRALAESAMNDIFKILSHGLAMIDEDMKRRTGKSIFNE